MPGLLGARGLACGLLAAQVCLPHTPAVALERGLALPSPRARVRPCVWFPKWPKVKVGVGCCRELVFAMRTPEALGGACQTRLKGLWSLKHISVKWGEQRSPARLHTLLQLPADTQMSVPGD